MPFDPDSPTDGLRLLRRHHEGTIQYHERRAETRFVLEGATGALVFPAEPGFLAASELVVHLPDEVERKLQLSVAPKQIQRPEGSESVDRWHAYHAAAGALPPGRVWLSCTIEGAKRPHAPGDVYEPESLMLANALCKAEPKLVKHANTDRARLGKLCKKRANVEVADALCVGVDPFGLDIRARFGIIRIEFDLEAATPEQAQALIDAMLERV